MKLYVIPAGTTVVLANEDGTMETVISKSEVTFSDTVEDAWVMSRDPFGFKPIAPAHIRAMFNDYYAMFNIGKEHTKKPYKYAIVNYNDVEVLC